MYFQYLSIHQILPSLELFQSKCKTTFFSYDGLFKKGHKAADFLHCSLNPMNSYHVFSFECTFLTLTA